MRQLMLASLGLLATGCVAQVDMEFDEDGDGLVGEDRFGSDPGNPDSDGDKHEDGAEVTAGHDPMDPNDHPYFGGWDVDFACRDVVKATGQEVGDIAEDFVLTDQYGDTVRFYDFCARAMIVEISGFT